MNETPQRHILVVEPNPAGHRLYYVKLIAQVALDLGFRVTILTQPSARESPEWHLHLEAVTESINCIFRAAFRARDISEVALEGDFDHVVVPDGDRVAIDIGLSGKWTSKATLTALVMRSQDQAPAGFGLSALKGWAKTIILARSRRVVGVKVCFLRSPLWTGASSLEIVRDPVTLIRPDGGKDEVSFKLDKEQYWFGVVGAITDRKNVPLVAESLAALNRSDVGLLIAGQLTDSVRTDLEPFREADTQRKFSLKIVDRLLSDREMDQLICELDCVVLAHSNEGSSGIFGKAAAAGTRVVAAGALSLKRDCSSAPDIALWSPLEQSLLSTALDEASRRDRPQPRNGLSSREFAMALL